MLVINNNKNKRDILVYVGTYTNWNETELQLKFGNIKQGIHTLKLDREGKQLVYEDTVTGVINPSFLTVDSDLNKLYAVNETQTYEGEASGSISSFSIDAVTGKLTYLNQKSTGGKGPCHVTVSHDGRFLIISNYTSGSVCVYEVEKGGIGSRTSLMQHEGSSVNIQRQSGPHAHSSIVMKEMAYVIVMDLGLDQLLVYEIKKDGSLRLCESSTYFCKKGSGPRHAEFHPTLKCLYVINELSSDISVLMYEKESVRFECIQTISTIPEECKNTCADIHVSKDGRFLYASNRGHDSIAVYAIHADIGTLTLVQRVSCGGKTPRNFTIEPGNQFLLVANQDSNDVVMFEIHPETGFLEEVNRVVVPSPVCLCPVLKQV